MVVRANLVAGRHDELLTVRIHHGQLAEIVLKGLEVNLVILICGLERYPGHTRYLLVFALVAKDYVGQLAEVGQHILGAHTVVPQIFPVVDVETDEHMLASCGVDAGISSPESTVADTVEMPEVWKIPAPSRMFSQSTICGSME